MKTTWLKAKGKGGFTLVEIMVVVAVVAILLLGMMAMLMPIFRHFGQTKHISDAKAIADTSYTTIMNRLKVANELWVNEALGEPKYIRISSNKIECDNYTLDEDYFGDYTIEVKMSFSRPEVEISITVFDAQGESIYTTQGTKLRLDNFDSRVEGASARAFPSATDVINPSIEYKLFTP